MLEKLKEWSDSWWMFDYTRYHHLYTGIILIVIGLILNNIWITSVGVWLTLDDIGQHRLQKVYDDPNYHSFGHYIGRPLYSLRRWLVAKLGWEWLNKF